MSQKWDALATDIGYELLTAMAGLETLDEDDKASFGFQLRLHSYTVTIKKGLPKRKPSAAELMEPSLN